MDRLFHVSWRYLIIEGRMVYLNPQSAADFGLFPENHLAAILPRTCSDRSILKRTTQKQAAGMAAYVALSCTGSDKNMQCDWSPAFGATHGITKALLSRMDAALS